MDFNGGTEHTITDETIETIRPFLNGIDGMVFICSPVRHIVFANDAFINLIGKDIIGESCEGVFDQGKALCPWCQVDRVLAGETLRSQLRFPKSERWFSSVSTPVRLPNGEVYKMTILQDITEDKKSEIAEQSEKEYSDILFETAPSSLVAIDGAMNITRWNKKAHDISGVSPDVAIGRNVDEFIVTVGGTPLFHEGVLKSISGNLCLLKKDDGHSVPVSIHTSALSTESGLKTGAVIRFEPIEGKSLNGTNVENLLSMADSSDYFIGIASINGTIEYINKAGLVLSGYHDLAEVRKLKLSDLVPGSHVEDFMITLYHELMEKGTWSKETQVKNVETGKKTDVLIDMFLIRGQEGGDLVAIGCFMRNMTHHNRMRRQFQKVETMESITRFSESVAHDFNNILTTILGYSDIILDDPVDTVSVEECSREIKHAVELASSLTRRLLIFSNNMTLNPAVVDVNHLLRHLQPTIEQTVGSEIDLSVWADPSLWMVSFDTVQFSQLVLNIVNNAREAMPNGGSLSIRTTNTVIDSINEMPVSMVYGEYVHINISDTGRGMSQEILEHAFEPFYSTKPKTSGSGLGLSTCYGIVKKNNGHIWLTSVPGKGTTVHILLPKAPESIESEQRNSEIAAVKGTETVLIVDDEDLVRGLMARILRIHGYTVLDAIDSKDALKIASEFGESNIDLLLTDIMLIGKNGIELANDLMARNADMRVMFISSHYDNTVLRFTGDNPHKRFLSKPFTTAAFLKSVRDLLDIHE